MMSNLQSLLKQRINENIKAHSQVNKEFSEFDVYKESKIQLIDMDRIKPNPAQPRLEFDDEKIGQLVDSIADIGLLQPISIRPTSGGYEIIAGERRFRAYQQLGKKQIECIVLKVSDEQNVLLALAENLSRDDLSDYEVAKAVIAYKNNFPNKTEYAKSLGISRQKLYKLFAFESLSDDIIELLNQQPKLLSADTVEQINTFKNKNINETNQQHFLRVLTNGLHQLSAGKINQSSLVEFLEQSLLDCKECPNSDKKLYPRFSINDLQKNFVKDGKTIGKLRQTNKKFIIDLNVGDVSEEQRHHIESFLTNLFQK